MDIRNLRPDDIVACNDFYNREHGSRRTLDQWRWEFLAEDGEPCPFVVAEEDGRILGTQALLPLRMVDDRGVFWTAKSEETLLDGSLRGKGVFKKMYSHLFAEAERRGILSIWGFTSATKAFTGVGFETPCEVTQRFLPLSRQSLAVGLDLAGPALAGGDLGRRLGRIGMSAAGGLLSTAAQAVRLGRLVLPSRSMPGLELRDLDAAPADAGSVSERFVALWGGTTLYRDAGYMDWRFIRNPHLRPILTGAFVGGRLAGWVAWSLDQRSMAYLVDLMAAPEAGGRDAAARVTAALIDHATARMCRAGAIGVRAWSVNRHPFDLLTTRLLWRRGFLPVPRGGTVVLRSLPGSDVRPGLGDFSTWYVNRAYTEGILG